MTGSTMPSTNGWDDTRLDTAFLERSRATAPTPPDLVGTVRDRIAAAPRANRVTLAWRLAPALGLAGTAVLAVVIGVGQLGPIGPVTSARPTTPTSSALIGSPLTISQAIAIRDGGVDDREIAVTGFLGSAPRHCPATRIPANPTRLDCPPASTWLMENRESLMTSSGGTITVHGPKGPAIQPSFQLVSQPPVGVDESFPPAWPVVTVIGHFDDRRANLCEAVDRDDCANTFVVDRVAAVNGAEQTVTTNLRTERWDEATQATVAERPRDLEADVDRLILNAVPGGWLLSRTLVTIDQVIGIEPVLADDDFIPHVGNPATLVWIVTVLDAPGAERRARTFALVDGSSWFAEVTAGGAMMRERRAIARPSDGAQPPVPSGDPTAFDSAPTSVVGITVRDIATVMRERRAAMDGLGRDEVAIRAWYVGPDPAALCEPATAPIHPPTPPCDQARHWLLDRPEQFGTEIGQLRTDPAHWPPVLNPLWPVDVPMDVPATWANGVPAPRPVVVLGHFEDNRVDAYAGNLYFVIDVLAWMPNQPVGVLDTVTRLTTSATGDVAAVLARIDEVSANDAVATWTTVVDAADFGTLEPRTAADAPEFTSGAPVWIVRRLIRNVMDDRQRLAIEWAYTTDQGSRIWLTATPDSLPDLVTTLDLHDPDARTRVVRVFDYAGQIAAVHSTGVMDLDWRRMQPREAGLDIARGASDREVALRWTSGACDPEWQVLLRSAANGSGSVNVEVRTFGDYCPGDLVPRSIIVEFDHPIALDALTTTYNPSGG